eukprot:gene11891-14044_t
MGYYYGLMAGTTTLRLAAEGVLAAAQAAADAVLDVARGTLDLAQGVLNAAEAVLKLAQDALKAAEGVLNRIPGLGAVADANGEGELAMKQAMDAFLHSTFWLVSLECTQEFDKDGAYFDGSVDFYLFGQHISASISFGFSWKSVIDWFKDSVADFVSDLINKAIDEVKHFAEEILNLRHRRLLLANAPPSYYVQELQVRITPSNNEYTWMLHEERLTGPALIASVAGAVHQMTMESGTHTRLQACLEALEGLTTSEYARAGGRGECLLEGLAVEEDPVGSTGTFNCSGDFSPLRIQVDEKTRLVEKVLEMEAVREMVQQALPPGFDLLAVQEDTWQAAFAEEIGGDEMAGLCGPEPGNVQIWLLAIAWAKSLEAAAILEAQYSGAHAGGGASIARRMLESPSVSGGSGAVLEGGGAERIIFEMRSRHQGAARVGAMSAVSLRSVVSDLLQEAGIKATARRLAQEVYGASLLFSNTDNQVYVGSISQTIRDEVVAACSKACVLALEQWVSTDCVAISKYDLVTATIDSKCAKQLQEAALSCLNDDLYPKCKLPYFDILPDEQMYSSFSASLNAVPQEKLSSIDISGQQIMGVLPPIIAARHFSASENRIAGGVPDTLCESTASLLLSDNWLRGRICSKIGKQLRHLVLSFNDLENADSDRLGLANSSFLKSLDLTGNSRLGGPIQELLRVPNLKRLSIAHCNFSHSKESGLLHTVVTQLPQLQSYDIGGNPQMKLTTAQRKALPHLYGPTHVEAVVVIKNLVSHFCGRCELLQQQNCEDAPCRNQHHIDDAMCPIRGALSGHGITDAELTLLRLFPYGAGYTIMVLNVHSGSARAEELLAALVPLNATQSVKDAALRGGCIARPMSKELEEWATVAQVEARLGCPAGFIGRNCSVMCELKWRRTENAQKTACTEIQANEAAYATPLNDVGALIKHTGPTRLCPENTPIDDLGAHPHCYFKRRHRDKLYVYNGSDATATMRSLNHALEHCHPRCRTAASRAGYSCMNWLKDKDNETASGMCESQLENMAAECDISPSYCAKLDFKEMASDSCHVCDIMLYFHAHGLDGTPSRFEPLILQDVGVITEKVIERLADIEALYMQSAATAVACMSIGGCCGASIFHVS